MITAISFQAAWPKDRIPNGRKPWVPVELAQQEPVRAAMAGT